MKLKLKMFNVVWHTVREGRNRSLLCFWLL